MQPTKTTLKENYEWVLSCIKSCKNDFQLESCKVLISLFENKYSESQEVKNYSGLLLEQLITIESRISITA
jgi:hypothetical protein